MKFLLFFMTLKLIISCSNEVDMSAGGRRSEKNKIISDDKEEDGGFSNSEAEEASEEQVEDDAEPSLPNEENDEIELTDVTVGFNYGDKVKKDGTDDDWNDGVVCITGKYRVNKDKGTVLSMEDQSVELSYRDGSGDIVEILVEGIIGNPDNPASKNTIINYAGDRGSNGPLLKKSYNFKKGELIKVTFNKEDSNVAYVPFKDDVDPVAVRLLKDVCNLTGN